MPELIKDLVPKLFPKVYLSYVVFSRYCGIVLRKILLTLLSAISENFLCCFCLLVFTTTLEAQPAGWTKKDIIRIEEREGVKKINYQVLLVLDTKSIVSAGAMKADGSDIRFSKDCSGAVQYPYWIESGMNTPATSIWILMDTLLLSSVRTVVMYYGNPAATAVSNFDITFPPARRRIDTTTAAPIIVSETAWNYDWVEIRSGVIDKLDPTIQPDQLTITARKIKISGTLDGTGSGYAGGTTGAGGGQGGGGPALSSSGGGGGYGAVGGKGSNTDGGAGGDEYGDSSSLTIEAGSGGGRGYLGSGALGGNGGGAFDFTATNIEISGSLLVDGGTANDAVWCGGGGSGGGILLKTERAQLSGTISAKGGKGGGGSYGGGGGAGGRIKIFIDTTLLMSSSPKVTGGLGGAGGTPAAKTGGECSVYRKVRFEAPGGKSFTTSLEITRCFQRFCEETS